MPIITLARKPLQVGSTVAQNALQYGTGGLNIDACRIGFPQDKRAAGTKTYSAGKLAGENAPHDGLGRWPANMILEHKAGCICAGVKQVSGTRDHRPEGDGGREDKTQWRFRPTGATRRGYSDSEGKETIPAWDCEPDCPVVDLDNQSGELTSGVMKAGTDAGHRLRVYSDNGGYAMSKDTYGDKGGASRFFFQISQNQEANR